MKILLSNNTSFIMKNKPDNSMPVFEEFKQFLNDNYIYNQGTEHIGDEELEGFESDNTYTRVKF